MLYTPPVWPMFLEMVCYVVTNPPASGRQLVRLRTAVASRTPRRSPGSDHVRCRTPASYQSLDGSQRPGLHLGGVSAGDAGSGDSTQATVGLSNYHNSPDWPFASSRAYRTSPVFLTVSVSLLSS